MIIGNESFNTVEDANWHSIFIALTGLPSAVRQTHQVPPTGTITEANRPRIKTENQMVNRFKQNKAERTKERYKAIMKAIEQFAEACEQEGDTFGQAHHLIARGELAVLVNDYKPGLEALRKAGEITEKLQNFDAQSIAFGSLYFALIKFKQFIQQKMQDPMARAEAEKIIEEIKEELQITRLKARTARCRSPHAAPPETSAIGIGQGEIGFTGPGGPSIGTYDIYDCVTVVVEHPEKIGVAHVDANTAASSLQYLFGQMPQSSASEPLKLILVGAHDADDEVCRINIRKILEYCHNNDIHVKIESSDVMKNSTQASAIVVDPDAPSDERIVEKVAEGDYERVAAANFLRGITEGEEKPLHIAFDTTISHTEKAPMLVMPDVTVRLSDMGDSDEGIYKWCRTNLGAAPEGQIDYALAGSMEAVLILKIFHNTALDHIWSDGLNALVERFQQNSQRSEGTAIDFPENEVRKAWRAILQCPFYIGPRAKEANLPLINTILSAKVMFDVDRTNPQKPVAKFKEDALEKLQAVPYAAQPYEAIAVRHTQANTHSGIRR